MGRLVCVDGAAKPPNTEGGRSRDAGPCATGAQAAILSNQAAGTPVNCFPFRRSHPHRDRGWCVASRVAPLWTSDRRSV